MPKHRSLIVGAKVVSAGRKRKCYHDRTHSITKGDRCLEVRDGMTWKGYCVACAANMFALGLRTLTELQQEIA